MSRLMGSVLKLVHVDREKGVQKNKKHSRKKGRNNRSLQYADSFIFVPAGADSNLVLPPPSTHVKANTFADNLSSPQRVPLVAGMNIGKSIKSRISQDVEDVSTNHVVRESPHLQRNAGSSFAAEGMHFTTQNTKNHSSNNLQTNQSFDSVNLEIHCPPGERYCHIRPYSGTNVAAEYAKPTDCIRPVISWHQSIESDLDSIGEEEGDYATVGGDSDKFMKTLGRPLSPRDVLLGERIGEGQFGDVHTGVLYPDSTEEARVAVKTCKSDSAPEEKAKFLQEAAVMKQFNHQHIIKLFGVVTQGYTTYIVMELAPLGQLRQYLIQKDMEIARSTLLEFIRQLCSAMVHLETKNYVHRDIAARNILVVAPDKIKLSDFGLSRWLEEADFYVASRGKLPIKWMAPESINFRRFTGASDVWMFGVCCWEILMRGVKPFMGIKNDEVIGKLELGERLSLPPECPGPLFNLLNHCWQYDAEDRPTFKDLEQQIEYILDDEWQLMKGLARGRGYDGPPLPPRNPLSDQHQQQQAHWNRRSGNIEDHRLLQPTLSSDSSISPPPPLPPRPPTNNGRPLPSEPLPPHSTSPSIRLKPHGSDSSVDPYLITNIPGALPPTNTTSSSSVFSPPANPSPPSPINRNHSTSPIPPPAILRNQQQHQQQQQAMSQPEEKRSDMGGASEGVYYSTVSGEVEENIQKSVSQLKLSREPSPYEVSMGKEQMSPTSNSSLNDISEDDNDEGDEDENNEVLEHTTAVVKTVMALNTQLPEAKPSDYPELVKGVGVALRELLAKVDQEMESLPEQTHQKVQMAHKVLSSDMAQLVKAMKDLQENYHSFVVEHYQKQMLQSATIIAVNSKHLLEAFNKARRLSRRSQR